MNWTAVDFHHAGNSLNRFAAMSRRLQAILIAIVISTGFTGCAHDPFACCDRRASLADWFDMYGPTGCYCPDGSPRCSNGNCR